MHSFSPSKPYLTNTTLNGQLSKAPHTRTTSSINT
jgi:hypothetical protein